MLILNHVVSLNTNKTIVPERISLYAVTAVTNGIFSIGFRLERNPITLCF